MFPTSAVEAVKSCIGLSLLLANLYLQMVNFLLKRLLFLQLHTSNFPVASFVTCVKFAKSTLKFLEVIDPFVTEIWSFMAFHNFIKLYTVL